MTMTTLIKMTLKKLGLGLPLLRHQRGARKWLLGRHRRQRAGGGDGARGRWARWGAGTRARRGSGPLRVRRTRAGLRGRAGARGGPRAGARGRRGRGPHPRRPCARGPRQPRARCPGHDMGHQVRPQPRGLCRKRVLRAPQGPRQAPQRRAPMRPPCAPLVHMLRATLRRAAHHHQMLPLPMRPLRAGGPLCCRAARCSALRLRRLHSLTCELTRLQLLELLGLPLGEIKKEKRRTVQGKCHSPCTGHRHTRSRRLGASIAGADLGKHLKLQKTKKDKRHTGG